MSIVTDILAANGQDVGAIFSPYSSGSHPANTGWLAPSGADLAQLLQPLVGSPQVAATGVLASNGQDLNQIFGVAAPVANPGYGNMEAVGGQSHGSGNLTVQVLMDIKGDGTWLDTAISGQPSTGNWYSPTTANAGNGYYVKIIFTKTGGTGVGTFSATNIGPVLIGTGTQQASASLTYGAGGVSTATATGTCQVIISTDAAQTNIVSNQTVTFHLEVDIV